jgi:flagellar motility protein MotE (MotC chaperone)
MEHMYADAMTSEIDDEFKKEAEKLRKEDQEKLKELDTLYTRIKQRISI